MTDNTAEAPEETMYEVSILAHPFAAGPFEAYLMTVDMLIRTGVDGFHPLITDTTTGDRWLVTPDGKLVSGDEMHAAVARLREQLEADGTPD